MVSRGWEWGVLTASFGVFGGRREALGCGLLGESDVCGNWFLLSCLGAVFNDCFSQGVILVILEIIR